MAVWDEVRVALVRLREDRPGALTGYQDPDRGDGGSPPYQIWLAPWAEAEARELHGRFGDQVELMVGALAYPPGRPARWPLPAPGRPADPLGAEEAVAELDGPAVVRSGYTLRHGLLVRNRGTAALAIATNGHLTASVVDPETGEVVGGFFGAQTLPLIMYRVAQGTTQRIPLLIGTASFTQQLGYAVPPGNWGVQATLDLGDPDSGERTRRRTPVLPVTVTA
jgi:hypothetical protein